MELAESYVSTGEGKRNAYVGHARRTGELATPGATLWHDKFCVLSPKLGAFKDRVPKLFYNRPLFLNMFLSPFFTTHVIIPSRHRL